MSMHVIAVCLAALLYVLGCLNEHSAELGNHTWHLKSLLL